MESYEQPQNAQAILYFRKQIAEQDATKYFKVEIIDGIPGKDIEISKNSYYKLAKTLAEAKNTKNTYDGIRPIEVGKNAANSVVEAALNDKAQLKETPVKGNTTLTVGATSACTEVRFLGGN